MTDLELARNLYLLKEDDNWMEAFGDSEQSGITTWSEYLSQPEVNISRYRADKLIRIYKHFSDLDLIESVIDCPVNALDHIARNNITDSGKIVELVADAENLSPKDFKEKFHDETTDGNRTYTYLVMKRCVETGTMTKVHGIESHTIEKIISKLDIET